jgi:hypothetical protein
LRRKEFLTSPADFNYWDTSGQPRRLRLKTGSFAFTYCQTPVIYRIGRKDSIAARFADGSRQEEDTLRLKAETSQSIFERTGQVDRIIVSLSHSGKFIPPPRI